MYSFISFFFCKRKNHAHHEAKYNHFQILTTSRVGPTVTLSRSTANIFLIGYRQLLVDQKLKEGCQIFVVDVRKMVFCPVF